MPDPAEARSLSDRCACCTEPAVPETVGPKRLAGDRVYCADCAYALVSTERDRLRLRVAELEAELARSHHADA